MKAIEIMTRCPQVVTPEEPLASAAALMEDLGVGFLPVVEDRETMRLCGVITDRDITVRHVARHHRRDCRVRDHMTRGHIDAVRADDDVHDVIGRMRHDQIRRIPVIGEGHRLLGVIAQADVALRVGQAEPVEVEEMLAGISRPATLPADHAIDPEC